MSVLLHISDTHFGTEQPDVLQALLSLAWQQRPEVVVLSGDITQRARKSQFDAALAFTHRLGAPVLAIPGNHDIPLLDVAARLFTPYAGYCAAFGSVLEPVHSSQHLLVVCVNTTRRLRHVHGEISQVQVDRVAQRISTARAEQLRVVVVHQPIAVMHAQDEVNLLRGHTLAQQRWAAAGADIVLGGHIHLPYVMPIPGVARPMWAVQAGTAVSLRTRPGVPNSVNVIRWGHTETPGQCSAEQWDFDAGKNVFACVKVTTLRTARFTKSSF
jgi:3',5'-cyclic AMP phosphodiesterase CpdA